MSSNNIIELVNVSKSYNLGNSNEIILKNINLKVKKGELIAIIGASGSGKSTLLHIIGLLDKPTEGEVYINDVNVKKYNDNKLSNLRGKNIGFVFQFFNLYPSLNVKKNVQLPMAIQNISKFKQEKRSIKLLKMVGLIDKMNNMPSQLSGGEKQRVSIARSIANNPDIILADEPTGNLDSKTGEEIIKMLINLKKDKNKTIIIITHDKKLASNANRIIEIKDGIIISDKHTKPKTI